jgi:hypothetical protein
LGLEDTSLSVAATTGALSPSSDMVRAVASVDAMGQGR